MKQLSLEHWVILLLFLYSTRFDARAHIKMGGYARKCLNTYPYKQVRPYVHMQISGVNRKMKIERIRVSGVGMYFAYWKSV